MGFMFSKRKNMKNNEIKQEETVNNDQEYLVKIFDYTKFIWNKLSKVEGDYEHIDINSNDADEIYKYMIALAGFDGFPQVYSDKRFNCFVTKCLYRGVEDIKHAQNLLCDHDYHHGRGYTNGIFTAIRKDDALQYTYNKEPYDDFSADSRVPQNVITLKLKNPNPIYYSLLETFANEIRSGNFLGIERETKNKLTNFVNFVNSIENDEECLRFLNIFLQDLSKLAIYLGYDSIIDNKGYIILDRSKIVVSQSELDRIKNGGEFSKPELV